MMKSLVSGLALAVSMLAMPALAAPAAAATPEAPAAAPAATPADVDAWLASADKAMAEQTVKSGHVQWVYQTYVNDDTAGIVADSDAAGTLLQVAQAKQAAAFAKVPGLSPETLRRLTMIRTGITTPAPSTPGAAEEFSSLQAHIQGVYATGHATRGGVSISGHEVENAMITDRNPDELKEMWLSWHDSVGAPMKADYARMVAISNAGARELGYSDTGALWRGNYDMTPDEFAAMTEKVWGQVRPLYQQLHCYVRGKLNAKYGDAVQAKTGPIRADLLGNMWAQEWGGIYDIVAPKGAGDIGYDLTDLLKAKGYDPIRMVKTGEQFYTSLGFAPLPKTFWERSQFTKPRDREVVCHASAWDIDNKDDLRVKMCLEVNATDFSTVHHELGHNFYQRAYSIQPLRLYEESANDGFHEAIGDTMALSITPDYLVKLNLLDPAKVPGPDKDIGLLLRQAMDKVAFLPFGLMIDRWRWGVFDGSITPATYEKAWNDMRLRYQGIVPPGPRGADAFDPGAKYHVAASVPYTRYFLARILQFQFYEAACKQAGWKGPLHRCSFYGNRKVGANLDAMLKMGASRPWPEALKVFTGTREMDGGAMLRYFAPLSAWLNKQNEGQDCGW